MEKNKPTFRGKFKFSLCKWLRINNKIYTENDENTQKDWDMDGLINGNKPIIVKRRPPVFYIIL
jgi:hypothetical protein